MNGDHERDPLDSLRSVNPVDVDHLSSASLARIRARISEDVMATTARKRSTKVRSVGIGAFAAIAAFALVLFVSRPGAVPGVAPQGSTHPGSASCVEPYAGPASVAKRALAFDGTVTAINDDKVTFAVNAAYRGSPGASVTLDAAGMTGTAITSAGGPNLAVGERYLVAGEDHFVWACGYTQLYDAGVAAQWRAAVG